MGGQLAGYLIRKDIKGRRRREGKGQGTGGQTRPDSSMVVRGEAGKRFFKNRNGSDVPCCYTAIAQAVSGSKPCVQSTPGPRMHLGKSKEWT